MKRAVVIIANNALEHHVTLVYRTVFLGETLALIERNPRWSAQGFDTLIDNLTLTDLIEVFASQPDCVFLCGDVHHARTIRFLAETARAAAPQTSIFVYGRATTFVPQFFDRQPISAVHESGDREVAIVEYLRYLDGEWPTPAGVRLVDRARLAPGRLSRQAEWAFPKLEALPVEGYRSYVKAAYGDHYSPRISATVGKGCSWGCNYCGATTEEGALDRRRDPQEVIEWAHLNSYLRNGFSFHLYHPNLFADRGWIRRFCDGYHNNGSQFHWRGVTTTVTLLDEGLVLAAGASGCNELAIGVETISENDHRSAKSTLKHLERAANNCRKAGISLKALVMVGYPGQTDDDLAYTNGFLTGNGMSIRFTGYTPLQRLRQMTIPELDALALERFDRRTYFDDEASVTRARFFSALIKNGGYEFPDY